MLLVDKESKKLHRLQPKKLAEAGFLEREHLQQMIRTSPEDFFAEIGETLLLIGEEVEPTDFVADRIDLLAIDPEGSAVVIELKRGTDKLQLLQALGYAGMISKWPAEKFFNLYARTPKSDHDPREELEQFLESEDIDVINQSQRIILFAEDFEYEVLVTAEWLTERYEVDIRCYRLALATEAEQTFLTCTCIYPPPEITEHAIRRKQGGSNALPPWPDWPTALSETDNPAVIEFFKTELAANRENNLRMRRIQWRFNGRRRFRVLARRKYAVVKQFGRFQEDRKFWTDAMGSDIKLRELDHGDNLRFLLQNKEQFHKLQEAFLKLQNAAFSNGSSGTVEADDVEAEE
jgi:hypothetical protein